jgi:xanthine dehydrogenase accessory factor
MTPAEVAREVLRTLEGGEGVVELTLLAAEPPLHSGARMLVWADRAEGTLGDAALDARGAELARERLVRGRAGTQTVEVEGGTATVYLEPHRPPEELIIVGAGHIARPLCRVGAMLGFRVIVLDDRPGFATSERFPEADRLVRADFSDPLRDVPLGPHTYMVLVTRGHKYDFDVLHQVLRGEVDPVYIGMVGSRRRVRAALEQLAQEGFDPERLKRLWAPIGLDIGAQTPEEIAVSIAGELVRIRRGGTGVSLRDAARVMERWIDRKS